MDLGYAATGAVVWAVIIGGTASLLRATGYVFSRFAAAIRWLWEDVAQAEDHAGGDKTTEAEAESEAKGEAEQTPAIVENEPDWAVFDVPTFRRRQTRTLPAPTPTTSASDTDEVIDAEFVEWGIDPNTGLPYSTTEMVDE